jgi:septal ring-binding cell division protein DamX
MADVVRSYEHFLEVLAVAPMPSRTLKECLSGLHGAEPRTWAERRLAEIAEEMRVADAARRAAALAERRARRATSRHAATAAARATPRQSTAFAVDVHAGRLFNDEPAPDPDESGDIASWDYWLAYAEPF